MSENRQLSIGGIPVDVTDETAREEIDAIMALIPDEASEQNQLADKAFVNSSIATATATFRGTYNLVSDLGLTTSATTSQIAAAIASALSTAGVTADNNDYVFVQIPHDASQPTVVERIDRYKYNGTAWAFEFSLNNSSFTSNQWAAINSGITQELVEEFRAKYDLPSGGIPKSDLASAVQTSLTKADNAAPQSTTYTKAEVDNKLTAASEQEVRNIVKNYRP